jgi:TonB family protein
MGTFFVYIIKSAFCLALFYLFYRLLLSKETFHRFNRIALLGLLALSCLVPLVEVSSGATNEISRQFLTLEEMLMMAELNSGEVVEAASAPLWGWKEVLLLLYIIGIVFFLVRNLWSLARMIGLIDGCKKERLDDGVLLFTHNKSIAPFSWMKCIVLSEKDLAEGGEAILTHERAHIRNHHSWDLLLADVCVFFQWFNPAAWLLKQELQNIHEYEADEWVINQGIDAKKYQLLLIKKAVGTRLYSMANSLNHSSLKKRIAMMIKKKSNPWARLKYLYILPLAAVSVAAFARPEVSSSLEEISSVKVNDLASIMKADEGKNVATPSKKKVKVAGKVVEEKNGNPLSGVSVIVRGTSNGTLAIDGKFSIDCNEGDVLMFSYVGMQTQSVIVPEAGSESMVISMKEEVQNLEEMVIVGYASNGEGTVLDGKTHKKVEQVTEIHTPKDENGEQLIFQVVEEMPSFPGGMNECMMFLAKNMRYPVAAQKAKIEGRVIVQFVVDRDGSIKDTQVVRSVSPELDAEAVRVVSSMPKWNPGKQRGKAVAVKYTMPVMFRLQKQQEPQMSVVNLKVDKDMEMGTVTEVKDYLRKGYVTRIDYEKLEEGETNPLVKNGILLRGENPDKKPIVVVDGEFKGYGSDVLSTLNPVDIETISVLQDKTGIEKFGELGKNGVILVTTKKNK